MGDGVIGAEFAVSIAAHNALAGGPVDSLGVPRRKSVPLTEKGNGKYIFTMPTGTVKVEAVFVLAETPETPWNNPFADGVFQLPPPLELPPLYFQ